MSWPNHDNDVTYVCAKQHFTTMHILKTIFFIPDIRSSPLHVNSTTYLMITDSLSFSKTHKVNAFVTKGHDGKPMER